MEGPRARDAIFRRIRRFRFKNEGRPAWGLPFALQGKITRRNAAGANEGTDPWVAGRRSGDRPLGGRAVIRQATDAPGEARLQKRGKREAVLRGLSERAGLAREFRSSRVFSSFGCNRLASPTRPSPAGKPGIGTRGLSPDCQRGHGEGDKGTRVCPPGVNEGSKMASRRQKIAKENV